MRGFKYTEQLFFSAIDKTTVEVTFGELEEGQSFDNVTFEFEGEAVEATWADEVATLTVPSMKYGFDYTVDVLDDGTEIASESLTYDLGQAAVITGEASDNEAVIGSDVNVTFAVEDQDADEMKGVEVRVRALDGTGDVVNDFGVLETNEDGEVRVTYGSEVIDAATLTFRAVVVERPVVRTDVDVTWTEVRNDLIAVDQMDDATLPTTEAVTDDGTNVRTYEVTFYDEYGNPLAAGEEVFVEVTGVDADGNPIATVENYTDETDAGDFEWNFNPDNAAQFIATDGLWGYELTEADEGTVTFKLVGLNNQEGTLTPTFYYGDADISAATVTVEAGATTFEDRVFSEGNSSIESLGEEVVATTAAREYVLNVKDQFGADFEGTLKFTFVEDEDELAGTDSGTIQFDIDTDGDGTYDSLAQTSVDTTGYEGVVNIQLSGGADGDSATPVIWFNTDGTGNYSDDQAQLVGEAVTFDANIVPTVTEFTLTTENAVASTAGEVIFTAAFFDQFSDEIIPGPNEIVFQAFNVEDMDTPLTLDASGSTVTIALDPTDDDFSGTTESASGTAYAVTAPSDEALLVKFESDTAGEYVLRGFIDINTNGTLESDEFVVTSETITIDDITATSVDMVTQSEFGYAGNDVDYTIQLLDQDENAYNASTANVDVTYTIENTGDVELTETVSGTTIAAGETETVTVTVSDASGQDTITLSPTSAPDADNAVSATVTVSADGIDPISVSTEWVEVDVTAGGSEATYNGTVVAFDTDNTWYVIETAIGNVVVTDYSGADGYKVNGNSTDADGFSDNLAVGATVVYEETDTSEITHELTK